MKYFFWIAFAVFLAASIPHVAYFFAAFEPTQGPESSWWWGVSYAIAVSIDVTVYLLSWTAFQRYRRYRTARAVWKHWLLIVICTVFSWAVNWAYAKQFHNAGMLSSAEITAPWLVNVFPFMASAFPLLGIVYTLMAETLSETRSEEQAGIAQITTLTSDDTSASARKALPAAQPQGALPAPRKQSGIQTITIANANESSKDDESITGQLVTLEQEIDRPVPEISARQTTHIVTEKNSPNTTDKLQLTLDALQANLTISDEALAELLSLKRPASARFWRLKAIEILNTSRTQSGNTPAMQPIDTWATPAEMNGKR